MTLTFLLSEKSLTFPLLISAVITSLLVPISAAALYITGEELVRGSIFTPEYTDAGITYGPFGLDFSYVRSFDGARLAKDLQINFLFDTALGYDHAQKAAYRARVEANVEGIWNNKYRIVDTVNKRAFPLVVDVTTTGPRFDQSVHVHPGSERGDALNWYIGHTPQVNAHEFGHMLGLFDEYVGGAIDRYPNPTLSDTGLMGLGALNAEPELLPRYYDQYLGYVGGLNPKHQFTLNPVPEPATIILVSLGSGVALLVRGWRGRHREAGGHSRAGTRCD